METKEDINGYSLSRSWFDFCFENPEKIKPNHTALYFFIIEHCNRLGWKSKFGLPTAMAKEAIGIRSYNTYINTLNDLVKFGFIKLIEKSKNQYSSNIVALSKFDKALDKALDKAVICSIKKSESTIQSTGESISSIDKQINQEPLTVENQINIIPLNANGSNNPKNPVGYLGTQNNPSEPKKPDTDTDTDTDTKTKTKTESIDDLFSNENILLKPIVSEWIAYKKEIKDPYKTVRGMKAFVKELQKLSNNDPKVAKEITDRSMANNWKGIFELNNNFNNNGNGKTAITTSRARQKLD